MSSEIKQFRDMLANMGVELIPKEAEKAYPVYNALKNAVKKACKDIPQFRKILESRTTEDKLEHIKMFKETYGEKMTLKEYNELQKFLLTICDLEGNDDE